MVFDRSEDWQECQSGRKVGRRFRLPTLLERSAAVFNALFRYYQAVTTNEIKRTDGILAPEAIAFKEKRPAPKTHLPDRTHILGSRHWEDEAKDLMLSKFTAVPLLISLGWGQSAVDTQKLRDAQDQGFALPTDAALDGNATIEAVLLPAAISKALFGKAIANQYAVIELTISNKSHDAALIVQSIFIDYSDWLLSGTAHAMAAAGLPGPAYESPIPNQVASVEYRIARGEALDAQAWTRRNWAMRTLQFLGVLATGSEFAFKEVGIVKGIGAFTGQLVPAAQVLWPDGTVAQLDRISDFGFRANKVIPKEASDIVVAFFPLDRFITPQLKKMFLASPAVFFVPAAALVDKSARRKIIGVLQNLIGAGQVRPDASVESLLSNSKILGLLDGISLNRVRVKVGGTLSLDVDAVPARVDSVSFDNPSAQWDGTHPITGIIQGAFLSNGRPLIAESDQYGISLQSVADQSTGEQLHFKLALSQPVAAGTVLHLKVTKSTGTRVVNSIPIEVKVPGGAAITPKDR